MRRSDLVFFLTGAAALVYETIWARLLTRVLGSQASATAVVLAVFMAGLGLGALLAAGPARRTRRPALMFAGCECFVGAWAVASPWILANLDPVQGFGMRALVSGLVLLPPTIAMGATFPLMGRLTVAARSATGEETSRFYGANTLGACLGVLLGVGVLMPLFGMRAGLMVAAVLNVLASGLALTLVVPQAEQPEEVGAKPATGASRLDLFLLVPLLFGLSSLMLEVLLTRILVTVTGASIYAFAIVLAVFLLGIGLGSRQARAALAQPAPGTAARLLLQCAIAVPLAACVGVLALRWQLSEPDLFASLGNRMPAATGTGKLWASHVLFAVLALLPSAFAFGMALPTAVAVACERRPAVAFEATLGRVYAANTLGALIGTLLAGFVLLPVLGARVGFGLALLPCMLAALLIPGRTLGRLAPAGALLAVLAFFALRPAEREGGATVLFHQAGLYEMVAVEESVEADGVRVRSIRLNGKVEASTAAVDLRLQRLLGHIPGLLHGQVRSALVIGMGTGMTAGSLLDLPTLERLTLFEIEPTVPLATAKFAAWNGPLLEDPRLTVKFGDGRHSLRTSTERFDLITADPLHVWSRGSSDLYTVEYYTAMSEHLAEGGIASQWIGLYELSTLDVKTVIATWCEVFDHTEAYLTAYDLALVGSMDPITTDLSRVTLPPRLARNLVPAAVYSGAEMAALQVAGDPELRDYCQGVPPMRDDLPILEFRAPFSFLKGYSEEVLAWCARDEYVEQLPELSRPRAREIRALLNTFLERLPQGLSEAGGRYGRELLALPPTDPVTGR